MSSYCTTPGESSLLSPLCMLWNPDLQMLLYVHPHVRSPGIPHLFYSGTHQSPALQLLCIHLCSGSSFKATQYSPFLRQQKHHCCRLTSALECSQLSLCMYLHKWPWLCGYRCTYFRHQCHHHHQECPQGRTGAKRDSIGHDTSHERKKSRLQHPCHQRLKQPLLLPWTQDPCTPHW